MAAVALVLAALSLVLHLALLQGYLSAPGQSPAEPAEDVEPVKDSPELRPSPHECDVRAKIASGAIPLDRVPAVLAALKALQDALEGR